jgi:hypothetical protein
LGSILREILRSRIRNRRTGRRMGTIPSPSAFYRRAGIEIGPISVPPSATRETAIAWWVPVFNAFIIVPGPEPSVVSVIAVIVRTTLMAERRSRLHESSSTGPKAFFANWSVSQRKLNIHCALYRVCKRRRVVILLNWKRLWAFSRCRFLVLAWGVG